MRGHFGRRTFAGIGIFIFASLLLGFVVMWLWNQLIPVLFHGPMISYWQAVGILVLTKILFRGAGHGRCGPPWKRHDWRERFESKLATMSPEDREKCRARWESYCGWHGEGNSESQKD